MLYLLGVPQLRHEDIDCTVFGLIAGSVEDRYSKNDDFVLCASFGSSLKNGLFAFQLGLAIPDGVSAVIRHLAQHYPEIAWFLEQTPKTWMNDPKSATTIV